MKAALKVVVLVLVLAMIVEPASAALKCVIPSEPSCASPKTVASHCTPSSDFKEMPASGPCCRLPDMAPAYPQSGAQDLTEQQALAPPAKQVGQSLLHDVVLFLAFQPDPASLRPYSAAQALLCVFLI